VSTRLYDYIIIGSGAGGAPLARYLCAAGHSVLMLEAGQRWQADEYPADEMTASARLMWNGGMDTTRDAGFVLLRGKVLGGGTVVNQALLDRFDDAALDLWAEQSGVEDFSVSAMARHYEAVESELSLESIAERDFNGNARIYVDGFDRLGYRWSPLRRGQSGCNVRDGNDCMRCLGGCPRDAKQSMPVTFLPKAERDGLEIVTGCQVQGLSHGARQVCVYGRRNEETVRYHGRRCVLAAGALGSTSIMLRSGLGVDLPALGDGFYCHPQFVTLGLYDKPVDGHKGSFQAVKSDDPRFREAGFKLENVFMGPVAAGYLLPGFGHRHAALMRQYRHMACIEVAVRDVTPGRIGLAGNGRMRVDKRIGQPEKQRAAAGLKVIEDIYTATGARRVVRSPVRIGLHLMGGAAMGVDRASSVVNPDGQVHGLPNLFVMDGSVFPGAPGINPSLSIMALAHRTAERLLGKRLATAEKQSLEEVTV
jgi:choline dehydrogenase-like flavoprotein